MMDITDSIIEKIKKAIRLANKTTSEGERDTAMRLAKRLADKNGIAFDDIEAGESEAAKAVKIDDEKSLHINGCEIGHVCFILKEHFGVVVMMNRLMSGKTRLSWFGSRLNIEIAKFVWHILLRESRKAWSNHRSIVVDTIQERVREKLGDINLRALIPTKKLVSPARRGAFMQGFFWAVHQKLLANPLRNDVAADRNAAEKKFEDFAKNNEVKEKNNRKVEMDADTLMSGLSAGKKVNLARPCENTSVNPLAIAL